MCSEYCWFYKHYVCLDGGFQYLDTVCDEARGADQLERTAAF